MSTTKKMESSRRGKEGEGGRRGSRREGELSRRGSARGEASEAMMGGRREHHHHGPGRRGSSRGDAEKGSRSSVREEEGLTSSRGSSSRSKRRTPREGSNHDVFQRKDSRFDLLFKAASSRNYCT